MWVFHPVSAPDCSLNRVHCCFLDICQDTISSSLCESHVPSSHWQIQLVHYLSVSFVAFLVHSKSQLIYFLDLSSAWPWKYSSGVTDICFCSSSVHFSYSHGIWQESEISLLLFSLVTSITSVKFTSVA